MERKLIRTFTEPTTIVVIGKGFNWMQYGEEYKHYFKSVVLNTDHEIGIADDESYVDTIIKKGNEIKKGYMNTDGYVNVITREDLDKLMYNGLFADDYFESIVLVDFIGSVYASVINSDTKERMILNDSDDYILYSLENEDDFDYERDAVIEIEGDFEQSYEYEYEGDE